MPPRVESPKLYLDDVELLPRPFMNFAGREGKYNAEGERSFHIRITEEDAQSLKAQGWTKIRLPGPEDLERGYGPSIEVTIRYTKKPPHVVLVTSAGHTELGEKDLDVLEQLEIERMDVAINGYVWENEQGSGIKPYLKTLYAIVAEDPIEARYNAMLAARDDD